MMRQGGCLCGAVRYRVEGEPLASGICHCRTCRKAASAPTLPFVVFPADRFAFTRRRTRRVPLLAARPAQLLRPLRLPAHLPQRGRSPARSTS